MKLSELQLIGFYRKDPDVSGTTYWWRLVLIALNGLLIYALSTIDEAFAAVSALVFSVPLALSAFNTRWFNRILGGAAIIELAVFAITRSPSPFPTLPPLPAPVTVSGSLWAGPKLIVEPTTLRVVNTGDVVQVRGGSFRLPLAHSHDEVRLVFQDGGQAITFTIPAGVLTAKMPVAFLCLDLNTRTTKCPD